MRQIITEETNIPGTPQIGSITATGFEYVSDMKDSTERVKTCSQKYSASKKARYLAAQNAQPRTFAWDVKAQERKMEEECPVVRIPFTGVYEVQEAC